MCDFEFRRLLERLPLAAYTCDADGLITFFNQRAVALWGRKPRLNHPMDRFCGSFRLFGTDGRPIPHERCWAALALSDWGDCNGHEIVIERPDGSRRTALAHANPFRDKAGKVLGAANVLVDITDRKCNEEALRDADRNKTDFLATLAHELRNPLAPIRNALEMMRLAGHNDVALAQARSIVERQVGKMVRLIDDLLDIARISRGKIQLCKEPIDLRDAIQDAIETSWPIIEELGHRLAVELPPAPITVEADRVRLAQVFANLLNNSARYTGHGGSISLIVQPRSTDVIVRIKDDGIGIPADMLESVFDMFTQANGPTESLRNGLGIGLSLVRKLVELHAGKVEVFSEGRGRGSEFVVRLPITVALFCERMRIQRSTFVPSRFPILVSDGGVRAFGSRATDPTDSEWKK